MSSRRKPIRRAPVGLRAPGEDQITPRAIEHLVDEIWIDGRLRDYYNFVDYHFDLPDGRYRARTYLDKIDTVSIYGPFPTDASPETALAMDKPIDPRLVAYLRRRFRVLKALGGSGYQTLRD